MSLSAPSFSSDDPFIRTLIAPVIQNPDDYPSFKIKKDEAPKTINIEKIVPPIQAIAAKLLIHQGDVNSLWKSKKLTERVSERLHRIYEFGQILSLFKENENGDLVIKATGKPTLFATAHLISLFCEVYVKEFVTFSISENESKEICIPPCYKFYVKATKECMHIMLRTPATIIGKGGCGIVCEVFEVTTACIRAFKFISEDFNPSKFKVLESILEHEITVLNVLNHPKAPYIVFDFRANPLQGCTLGFCTELYYSDLKFILMSKSLSGENRIAICRNVVKVLDSNFWSKGFRHSDICPENVLVEILEKGIPNFVICDLGSTRSNDLRPPKLILRRPKYISVIDNRKYRDLINNGGEKAAIFNLEWKAEVFQTASTIFYILCSIKDPTGTFTARHPYPIDLDTHPVEDSSFNGELMISLGYSSCFVNFLEKALVQDPDERLTLKDFLLGWKELQKSWEKLLLKIDENPLTSIAHCHETAVRLRQNLNPIDYPEFLSIFPSSLSLAVDPITNRYAELLSIYKEDKGFLAVKGKQGIRTILTPHSLILLIKILLEKYPNDLPIDGAHLTVDGLHFFVLQRTKPHILLLSGSETFDDHVNHTKRVLDVVTGEYCFFKIAVDNDKFETNLLVLDYELNFLSYLAKINFSNKHIQKLSYERFSLKKLNREFIGYFAPGYDMCLTEILVKMLSDHKILTEKRILINTKIIEAVLKIWYRGIRHLNIIPKNFFVVKSDNDLHLVITNFCMSVIKNHPRMSYYQEPMVITEQDWESLCQALNANDKSTLTDIEFKIDIYQLGVLLYQIFTKTTCSDFNKLKFDAKEFVSMGYSEELAAFLNKMLTPSYKDRMSISEFIEGWKAVFL